MPTALTKSEREHLRGVAEQRRAEAIERRHHDDTRTLRSLLPAHRTDGYPWRAGHSGDRCVYLTRPGGSVAVWANTRDSDYGPATYTVEICLPGGWRNRQFPSAPAALHWVETTDLLSIGAPTT